jgi:GDP-D-mannose 3',5'-epimerase
MNSNYTLPLNLGSTKMISINDLVYTIARLANKTVQIKNISGPVGVMGRNSDNALIRQMIDWVPDEDLELGLIKTYNWIQDQIKSNKQDIK